MEKKVGRWTIKDSERVYKMTSSRFWVDEVVGPDGSRGGGGDEAFAGRLGAGDRRRGVRYLVKTSATPWGSRGWRVRAR